MSAIPKNISELEKSIINTLIYYDVFNHPLSYEELRKSTIHFKIASDHQFGKAISNLKSLGYIRERKEFYMLNGKDWAVDSRLSEQKRVNRYFKIAAISSRIIASFPYVRGVFISGALSKSRVEEKGDIDFFIVTEAGKLWISRTMLVLFKKVFLFNSFRFFCLNYFVDENSLETPHKNLYTATDVVTVIPFFNPKIYRRFIRSNAWACAYYPNYPLRGTPVEINPYSLLVKTTLEKLFRNRLGKLLDTWLMNLTLNYRRKKFQKLPEKKFLKAFITEKHISTHHPNDFQEGVLKAFFQKQEHFEKQYRLILRDKLPARSGG